MKHKTSKLLSILLALVMVAGLLPGQVAYAADDPVEVSTWEDLQYALERSSNAVKLTTDINFSTTASMIPADISLNITGNKTIDLNGHTINLRNADNNDFDRMMPWITVNTGAVLTLSNGSIKGYNYKSTDRDARGVIWVKGTLNTSNVTIVNGRVGPAINCAGEGLKLSGGTIEAFNGYALKITSGAPNVVLSDNVILRTYVGDGIPPQSTQEGYGAMMYNPDGGTLRIICAEFLGGVSVKKQFLDVFYVDSHTVKYGKTDHDSYIQLSNNIPTTSDTIYWWSGSDVLYHLITDAYGLNYVKKLYVAEKGAEKYTITFNPNGGSVTQTSGTTGANGKLTSLPTPIRNGYTFTGWFTEAIGGSMINLNTEFSESTTVYAHWSENFHTITINGGTADRSAAPSGQTINITANTRENYTFTGWTVVSGGVTLVNASSASTSFTMGKQDVTIRANYTYSGAYLTDAYVYVIEPIGGGQPTDATVGSDAYNVTSTQWIDTETNTALSATDTFKAGKEYRLETILTSNSLPWNTAISGYVNDISNGVACTQKEMAVMQVTKTFTAKGFDVSLTPNNIVFTTSEVGYNKWDLDVTVDVKIFSPDTSAKYDPSSLTNFETNGAESFGADYSSFNILPIWDLTEGTYSETLNFEVWQTSNPSNKTTIPIYLSFTVTPVFEFTTQPVGGTAKKTESYTFSWETSDTPDTIFLDIWLPTASDWGTSIPLTGLTSYSETYKALFADGNISKYRIRATKGSETIYSNEFTVTWTDGGSTTAPTITTSTLPGGKVGTAYEQTLAATGDATITWTLDSGNLPAGLTLAADGKISGTPSVANTYTFTVKATNGAGSDTKSYTVTIAPADATTYTVSFNANSGGGTMADVIVNAGEKLTLPECTFTPPSADKIFDKWDAGNPGDKVDITSDCTITAIWKNKSVTKTLSSIAITTPPTKTTYTAGQSFNKAGMVVTATYSDSTTAPVTTYTVTPSGALKTTDTSVTISYTEGGVTKTATQAITVNSSGGSGGGGGGITTQYTLTYNTNGGSAVTATKHNSGTTVNLTATPTKEGFTFDGWYSDAALTSKITSIKMDGNKTVYAGWKENTNPNTGAHDCPSAHLKDVDITQWYHDGVDYVVAKKLMQGVAADQFAPNATTTRAMIVTILYRLEGEPAVSGKSGFEDVEADTWYTNAVAWAEANDIVNGYDAKTFGPMDPITREQMAAIMFRYSKFKGYDVSKSADLSVFTDNGAVSDWAVPAMKWAVAEELFKGVGDNLISPTTSATRAQVATILMRYIENVK